MVGRCSRGLAFNHPQSLLPVADQAALLFASPSPQSTPPPNAEPRASKRRAYKFRLSTANARSSSYTSQLAYISSYMLALQRMPPPPPRTSSTDSSTSTSSASSWSSASSVTSTSSYRVPSAPLYNPLPEGWAAHLHQVASEYSHKASATLLSSSKPMDKKRAHRDLEIAKAMEWLTEHPPIR